MADRKLGCLSIFLFVALCASVLVNFGLAVTAFHHFQGTSVDEESRPRFREMILERGTRGSDNKIAVITLRGLISTGVAGNVGDSMVDDLRWQLEQARNDDEVRAVVLEVDSPGGEVTASDMIYNAVVKTRAKKPVVVYMESLAASGGYYVSCGGKYLMANETSITGSIGVIIQTFNYEQLFNKIGLASVVFKSGKFKDMLNGARPMTPEERDYVQSFVMKTYEKFLGIVAKERNLPADTLRNGIADGRILSGRDALDNKLIDGLGQIEDAFAKARELGHAPDAKIVKYGPPFNFGRFFRLLTKSGDTKIELSLPGQLSPQLQSGRAYFLPSFYAP
ncbi:MAG: signal peptide peptidase SppA [Chthoniobacterales bacterium]